MKQGTAQIVHLMKPPGYENEQALPFGDQRWFHGLRQLDSCVDRTLWFILEFSLQLQNKLWRKRNRKGKGGGRGKRNGMKRIGQNSRDNGVC